MCGQAHPAYLPYKPYKPYKPMPEATDLKNPFREVYEALDLSDQRKALRGAMRREGNRLRMVVAGRVAASLGNMGGGDFKKNVLVRVYPPRYGAGFMLSVKGRNGHDPKIMHKTRDRRTRSGKVVAGGLKPILMWAEDGTRQRRQGPARRSILEPFRTAFTGRKRRNYERRGRRTGAMPRYGFLAWAERTQTAGVERRLFADFQGNLEKRLRKVRS